MYPYLEKSRQPTHLPYQLLNTTCEQLNGDYKRPETVLVEPRNKENIPRAWQDAQQRVNQAIKLTNLSARSVPYRD